MKSSSGNLPPISSLAPKRAVDNSLSIQFYLRIADNLLQQASIYRDEKNIIQQYIFLLRFSSLVSETIPQHQYYRHITASEKACYLKKLSEALTELEALKPKVQKKYEELRKVDQEASISSEGNEWGQNPQKSQTTTNILHGNNSRAYGTTGTSQDLFSDNSFPRSSPSQLVNQMNNWSLNLPQPKEETLSRHSFLGPSNHHRYHRDTPSQASQASYTSQASQASQTSQASQVRYPTFIDASHLDAPSLEQGWVSTLTKDGPPFSLSPSKKEIGSIQWAEFDSRILGRQNTPLVNPIEYAAEIAPLRQPYPPPVEAPVQNLPISVERGHHVPPWNVADPRPGPGKSSIDLMQTKGPKPLHISNQMTEEFLKLVKQNTLKNLETCGILAGSLKKGIFCVTTLIIPKQQATSDSCQTLNEEEIFDYQDKRGLFQLGWVHTHPTQTCFMSSVDLHTHYSYQVMLPEAVAIVMAPTDESRKCGIFRLSDPGGVKAIQECQIRGFHPHDQPVDGGPIYEHCNHVFFNPKLRFEVADLR